MPQIRPDGGWFRCLREARERAVPGLRASWPRQLDTPGQTPAYGRPHSATKTFLSNPIHPAGRPRKGPPSIRIFHELTATRRPFLARPVPPALAAAEAGAGRQDLKEQLIRLLARSYLRREGRFYHIDRPLESMSRDDLQRAFLIPARRPNNGAPVPKPVLKEVFDTAILQNNADPDRSIPVWTGAITPYPGNPRRRIQLESGQVIRHRCHNRLCINPAHLEIGSRADNKRDDWDYEANGVDFDLL